jgi:hypothetical protein
MDYATVLADFGGDSDSGRRAYRAFVAEGVGTKLDSPLAAAVHGLILGSDRFVGRIRKMLAGRDEDRGVPALSRLRSRPAVGEVVAAVARRFGSDLAQWAPGRRCDDMDRAVAAYLSRELAGAPSREIAAALGYRNVSSVSVACRRVGQALGRAAFARNINAIRRRLATNH